MIEPTPATGKPDAGLDLSEFHEIFFDEAGESLAELEQMLLGVDIQTVNDEDLNAMFRCAHSIKGGAATFGFADLAKLTHEMESLLDRLRRREIGLTATMVDVLLQAGDVLKDMLAEHINGSAAAIDTEALVASIRELAAAKSAATSTTVETASTRVLDLVIGPLDDPEMAARLAELIDKAGELGVFEPLAGQPPGDNAAPGSLFRFKVTTSQSDESLQEHFGFHFEPRLIAIAPVADSGQASAPPAAVGVTASTGAASARPAESASAAANADANAGFGFFDGAPGAPVADDEAGSGRAVAAPAAQALPGATLTVGSASAAQAPDASADDRAAGASAAAVARKPAGDRAEARAGGIADTTLRVSVEKVDQLINLVGELVITQAMLAQTSAGVDSTLHQTLLTGLSDLERNTRALQESVMSIRMIPMSVVFNRFPRMLRDLAAKLGKQVDFVTHGEATELDKGMVEKIVDPLTHLVRNSCDHGIEMPEDRVARGKSRAGTITLSASHQGGSIVIEVRDDGKGLNRDKLIAKARSKGIDAPDSMTDNEVWNLIFAAGFSTADVVTDVSGRGVGMDVVRTNIEKIGGTIEVSSVEGSGTRFVIRIPLTLTIVSALIVECCGERFALPQASLVELVSASGASGHAIEQLEGTAVLRLRDRLLPLVSLQQLLKLEPVGEPTGETCIVVARVGAFTYGVIVDRVFDTEEIVVKPVATVLRHVKLYSGATILGDGSVILILDPKGISLEAGATTAAGNLDGAGEKSQTLVEDRKALLVFRDADEALKAAPLAAVSRIEEIEADQIECVNGRTVLQYRGRLMPILAADAQPAQRWASGGRRPLLVFARGDETIGMLVEEIVDIVEIAIAIDPTSASEGALGSLIVAERATALIDVEYYWRRLLGEERAQGLAAPPAAEAPKVASAKTPAPAATALRRLLLIDASSFSQLLLQPLLGQAGYDVVVAASPEAALELYNAGERFQLIMADAPSEPAAAKAFARSLGQAKDWGATPLLSLALTGVAGQQQTGLEKTTLLAAVEAALEPLQGAA